MSKLTPEEVIELKEDLFKLMVDKNKPSTIQPKLLAGASISLSLLINMLGATGRAKFITKAVRDVVNCAYDLNRLYGEINTDATENKP